MRPGIGHPEVEVAVCIGSDDRIGLHHRVCLACRLEGVLADEEGLPHRFVYLAHVDVNVYVDIVFVFVVDLGSAFFHGFYRVEDGRQRLIVDLNI